ncbi:MAG: hypothetical protein IJ574_05830 [Bacilli bacterium]|nr:hypothetical protein [Bacilli bacterium]
MKKNKLEIIIIIILTFFVGFFINPTNTLAAQCVDIIGNPESEGTFGYYLQLIFNIMKYAAIILFAVFSVKDFFTAIINQDQKGVKKAFPVFTKRAVSVVIIFLLPTIVKFVISIFGKLQDPTCNIF